LIIKRRRPTSRRRFISHILQKSQAALVSPDSAIMSVLPDVAMIAPDVLAIMPDIAVICSCVDTIANDVAAVDAYVVRVAMDAIHTEIVNISRDVAIIVTDIASVVDDVARISTDIPTVLSYALRHRTLVHMHGAPCVTRCGTLGHTLCTRAERSYR